MVLDDFSAITVEGYYEASGEQVQNWNYHRTLNEKERHQILTFDLMLSELDVDAFEKSVEVMVKRHESLRTCLRMHEGTLRQCVLAYDHKLFAPLFFDVSTMADSEQEIRESIDECSYELRNLAEPPLWRSCVFKLSDGDYYLCFIIHHIICDAWGCKVIYNELGELYACFKNGIPVQIAPPEMQLRDYAVWQRKWMEENKQIICDYWSQKIERFGDSFFVEKYLDRSGCVAKAPFANENRGRFFSKKEMSSILNNGKVASFESTANLSQYTQLVSLSRSCNCSIWTIINTSLQLLFLHLMGREKILIAMPVISRYLPGVEKLIGSLGGAVYVYQTVNQEMTVKQYVQSAFMDFLEASKYLIYDHAAMNITDTGLHYFCDVFANYSIRSVNAEKIPELKTAGRHKLLEYPEFYGLSCFIEEYEDGLLYTWKYNLDLYPAEIMELMIEKHSLLLQKMCHAPEMQIKELIDII